MSSSIIEKFTQLNTEQRQEVIEFIETISAKPAKPAKKERLSKKENKPTIQEVETRYTSFKIW